MFSQALLTHELELEWGERVQRMVPSAERIRFTNSGTEATLMALRVSRIVTGRTKVLKFAGHFHGWHDQLIPAASPPHDDESGYSMPGVTEGVFGDLIIVPPNDLEAAAAAIQEHRPACVIHEGNGSRWGVVPTRAWLHYGDAGRVIEGGEPLPQEGPLTEGGDGVSAPAFRIRP